MAIRRVSPVVVVYPGGRHGSFFEEFEREYLAQKDIFLYRQGRESVISQPYPCIPHHAILEIYIHVEIGFGHMLRDASPLGVSVGRESRDRARDATTKITRQRSQGADI
ncbi:hypothetical protein ACKS0A_10453 [Histoplasma ohiense]